jgi:hypothetical protein
VFDGETPEARLRAAFLRDAEGSADEVLALITRARHAVPDQEPDAEWGGNEMSVAFHRDRAVITHQWIIRSEGEEEEIVIPLDEAETLLRAWQHEARKRRC